jgi:hypothetical protein
VYLKEVGIKESLEIDSKIFYADNFLYHKMHNIRKVLSLVFLKHF